MIKDILYKAYRKMNNSKLVCTLSFALYSLVVRGYNFRNREIISGREDIVNKTRDQIESLSQVKIAFICDEMTYANFSTECDAIYLTPYDWKDRLEKFQPDLVFCESAWEGLKEYKGCWRGKIYRNHQVLFENRKDLLRIVAYCKEKQIPTVFWNKEDPLFWGDNKYDFIDTALKFDYIYTTCQECIEKYKVLGHSNVDLLMFGVTPNIYNPLKSARKENKAIFAGSWYADQKERCRDTERVFDMVLRQGIELVIYDRNYGNNSFNTTYPEKYQKYIKPAVPYKELCDIIKRARFAITINTIKDSRSMFARRVFEIVMCNTTLISNESIGLRETFKNGIWFVDQDFDGNDAQEVRKENIEFVLRSHTNKARLKKICADTEVLPNGHLLPIALVYWNIDDDIYRQHKEQYVGTYARIGRFDGGQIQWDNSYGEAHIDYYYCVRNIECIKNDCETRMHHFEYLEKGIAIQNGGLPYTFIETLEWTDVLIRRDDIDLLTRNESIQIYCV